MKALPEEFDAGALPGLLADGWGFDAETADYAAVGAGSYHWLVRDRTGTPGFVTVDDLDRKSWLGDTRERVFDGLERAFDTALALRQSGLDFVVAPTPTRRLETVRRVDPRYAIALFPFVDGKASAFGPYDSADERVAVVKLLAELHRATPAVASVAGNAGLDLPSRRHLEAGLRELDEPWSGGPYSDLAREALARHASDVAELLALADRLAADIERRDAPWVVTHGEPHAANVVRAGTSCLLVDWDTVALAPPERDLWMVVESADDARIYGDATGLQIDDDAMNFFRLTWDLKDLAEYLDALRSPHEASEDTQRGYDCIVACLASRDRWAALL
jgi:spectinomycin phosphotransferase